LSRLSAADQGYGGRVGKRYASYQAINIAGAHRTMLDGIGGDVLDVRHPFLYQPLVELALQLPPDVVVRPHARKWVLREAMRGILPESVRTRVGKGEGSGLVAHGLARQGPWLERLLRDPILAQLGLIDPVRLKRSISNVMREQYSENSIYTRIEVALDLEIWLQLRSGRWAADHVQTCGSELEAASI
jgi:asparagine synthase (glutamine-hydrolysing)